VVIFARRQNGSYLKIALAQWKVFKLLNSTLLGGTALLFSNSYHRFDGRVARFFLDTIYQNNT
jgi:hypothetical protein